MGVSAGNLMTVVWEAAFYPWSVRLKALLGAWMPWIRQRFRPSAEVQKQLLKISARQMDRRLREAKRQKRRDLRPHQSRAAELRCSSPPFMGSGSLGARRMHREIPPLRNIETQLEQFAVNARCLRFRPPTCLTLGNPGPIRTKADPMPLWE